MDKQLIENAKKHAKERGTSLSQLIENYLKRLEQIDRTKELKVNPFVEELAGIISQTEGEPKPTYLEYLKGKYK